jgi:hypothetical protein
MGPIETIILMSWFSGFLIHFPFILQIDDVISQAQATRAVLGSQRALFGDVQGKVRLLGDKFPIIRSLLGMLDSSFYLSDMPLIFKFMSWLFFADLIHYFCRFDKKAKIKGYPYSVSSHCCMYVVSHNLLALKVTK